MTREKELDQKLAALESELAAERTAREKAEREREDLRGMFENGHAHAWRRGYPL